IIVDNSAGRTGTQATHGSIRGQRVLEVGSEHAVLRILSVGDVIIPRVRRLHPVLETEVEAGAPLLVTRSTDIGVGPPASPEIDSAHRVVRGLADTRTRNVGLQCGRVKEVEAEGREGNAGRGAPATAYRRDAAGEDALQIARDVERHHLPGRCRGKQDILEIT